MPDLVHFFTARGALCGAGAGALRLTLVGRSVTCAACAAALAERDQGAPERAARPLARIRLGGLK